MHEKIINRLFEDAFTTPRGSRSDEYKQGVLAALRFRFDSEKISCPFAQGTAAADAFFSGLEEGHTLWRNNCELCASAGG